MANFCIECGRELEAYWNVCPDCGTRAFNPLESTSSSYSYTTPSSYPYRGIIYGDLEEKPTTSEKVKRWISKKRNKGILIALIIILAAIIIPSAVFLSTYHFKTINYYVYNGYYSRSYTCSIPHETYKYYMNEPHPLHMNADLDVTASIVASYCTPEEDEINKIANIILSKCISQSDDEEVINALLSYTQGIGYKDEEIDIAQYPIETLIKKGDCEDLSIFFGSLVEALGYDAVILIVALFDYNLYDWVGHCCVGVYLSFTPTHQESYPPSYYYDVGGKEYWICETTGKGFMIGELPVYDSDDFVIGAYDYII